MMKYLLVEDERFAYEEMKRMMEKLRPDYQLEAWTATVEQTVQFLKHHPVDLMLLDIRLTDGNSFDIFEQIQVTTPVIFKLTSFILTFNYKTCRDMSYSDGRFCLINMLTSCAACSEHVCFQI